MNRFITFIVVFYSLLGCARAQVTLNSATTLLIDPDEPVAIQIIHCQCSPSRSCGHLHGDLGPFRIPFM